MMVSLIILCGIAAIFLAVYYYLTSVYDFWKSRNIRGPKPIPVIGNYKDVMLNKKCLADYFKEIYNEYKDESMIGIFIGVTPALIVKDPDLIKDILIKDFSKFANKELPFVSKNADVLSHNLSAIEYERWRPLRIRLSPAFTAGKIKEMFSLISECADYLEQYIEKLASKNEPIDCREVMAKYTIDVIGTCGFGIQMNALLDKDSEFRKIGKMILLPTWSVILRYTMKDIFPWLHEMFSYIVPNIMHREVNYFFVRFVTEIMNYRETNNVIRHDFIDILREIKKNPDKMNNIKMTENFIAAQAFIFFFAGFETSSTTMSNTLYELALNQQIQDKLREEINQDYTKHGSNLSYENVKGMIYLDKVFKETLRKYPVSTYLIRHTTESYTFGGSTLNIPKNLKVLIPTFGIHRDPDIYPMPDVFDPERFNDEAIQTRHPMHYLPFGDGPRNCIGARFAIYQTKIGLIKILRNYKVEICDKTDIPYINDPKSHLLLMPKNGIHLRIIKIKL